MQVSICNRRFGSQWNICTWSLSITLHAVVMMAHLRQGALASDLIVNNTCMRSYAHQISTGSSLYSATDLGYKCHKFGRIPESYKAMFMRDPISVSLFHVTTIQNDDMDIWNVNITWDGARPACFYLLQFEFRFHHNGYEVLNYNNRCILIRGSDQHPRVKLHFNCFELKTGQKGTMYATLRKARTPLGDGACPSEPGVGDFPIDGRHVKIDSCDFNTECTCNKQKVHVANDGNDMVVRFQKQQRVAAYAVTVTNGEELVFKVDRVVLLKTEKFVTRKWTVVADGQYIIKVDFWCSNTSLEHNTDRLCKTVTLKRTIFIPTTSSPPPQDICYECIVAIAAGLCFVAALSAAVFCKLNGYFRRRSGTSGPPNNALTIEGSVSEGLLPILSPVTTRKCAMLYHPDNEEHTRDVNNFVMEMRNIVGDIACFPQAEAIGNWQTVGEEIGNSYSDIVIVVSENMCNLWKWFNDSTYSISLQKLLSERLYENVPCVVLKTLRARDFVAQTNVHLVSFKCNITSTLSSNFIKQNSFLKLISKMYCLQEITTQGGSRQRCMCSHSVALNKADLLRNICEGPRDYSKH